MRHAVILAGGSGTRLWPLSRASRPKQLLSVVDGKSLLRLAYERVVGTVPADNIWICTGTEHRDAVVEHLPELPSDNVLGEPEGRDTANAVGLVASVLSASDPDATIAFLTSDHVIEPWETFAQALETAFATIDRYPATLITFGIVPTAAHTGLGYIERGPALDAASSTPTAKPSWAAPSDVAEQTPSVEASQPGAADTSHRRNREDIREAADAVPVYAVAAFREKPDLDTARHYLAQGDYLWNSGMFVWRADTVLQELAIHLPASHDGLGRIAEAWQTPRRDEVLAEVYPSLPKISIDYAVLEPAARGLGAARIAVVPLDVSWLDVGSWPALAATLGTDASENALDGATVLVDASGNIIVSDDPDHLVAAIGLSDTIVVHTHDVTMVCPRRSAERVKELVARVQDTHGPRYA